MNDSDASKEAAAKTRIITHMNDDHHDSVVRYLEHYHGLPGYKAYHGKISDISLSQLSFTCGDKQYSTPFEPAMKSFRDARERVVQMDKDCLAGLGRSDITIAEYHRPRGLDMVFFAIIITTFVSFSTRANFAPGGYIAAVVPRIFARFCWTIQPFVLWPMLVIHGAEAVWMTQTRLKQHSVYMPSKLWWQWTADTFIEGIGTFKRFDRMVKKQRAAKEKQKH